MQENYSFVSSPNRELSRVFVYGLERISQLRSYILNGTSHTQTSYYAYDGHGSTRALTDPNGAVTDTYDYDAFGNLIHSTATGIPPGGTTVTATPNEFLFAGEQFDSDLGLYYNRARYLNVSTGRFWTMDSYEGDNQSPQSLHKYTYVGGDPVNRFDLSGHDFSIDSLIAALSVAQTVAVMSNVIIAGAISAIKGGLPDAVAFGFYASGGFDVGGRLSLEGIAGVEILFAPRLKEGAVYAFAGAEGEGDLKPFQGFPDLPSLFTPNDSHLFHGEVGVFTAWYWNLKSLEADPIRVLGTSLGGSILGYESGPSGGPQAALFGFSSNLDPSVFGILGGSVKLGEFGMSKGAMLAAAAEAELQFEGWGLIRFPGSVSVAGGLAAAVISSGAVATWINWAYDRP